MAAESKEIDHKRLWLGNLDPRINEYQLLKLVQKYGKIDKFDLLFHRNGPLTGQPRGYAFVTYSSEEDALAAKEKLNGKQVGSKNIVATWAHSVNNQHVEITKAERKIPVLAISKNEAKTDREFQIQAIEAKLKLMERKNDDDDFEINKTVATETPFIAKYQFNKQQQQQRISGRKKPYNRPNTQR